MIHREPLLPNPVRILDYDTVHISGAVLSSVREFQSEVANFPPRTLSSISYGRAAFSAVFFGQQ